MRIRTFVVILSMVLAAALLSAITFTAPSAAQSDDATAESTAEPLGAAERATPAAGAVFTKADLEARYGWTCPTDIAGTTLNIYNWSTYIAEDTVSSFETLCDVTVNYDVFASNEEVLTRLSQGNPGYDLIMPSEWVVQILREEGSLLELDKTRIPNIVNIMESFTTRDYDPGNVYSVPYLWGTVGIGYNRAKVGKDIVSWNDVLSYEGPVAWIEDQRTMLGMGLVMLGFSPNSTARIEINQAAEFLIENSANVVVIAQDDGQSLLERGDVDIVVEYSGDIFQVISANPDGDFAFALPAEGTNLFIDNVVIPVGAPNPNAANTFIDFLLTPRAAADISNYVTYANANQASKDALLVDAALLENPGIYPTDEIISRLFLIEPFDMTITQYYSDAWNNVRTRIGD
jgi:spermidine/putrescine transport system substrate-binding protein